MKKFEMIAAGFGGQGILSLGQVMAYAGMIDKKEVTWMPSYGPEMRGGTANCSVVVSDQEVASPFIDHPSILVAMNLPSLHKFEHEVQTNGVVFVNSSIIEEKVARSDIKAVYVDAAKIAQDGKNPKGQNVVMLAKIVKETGIVSPESAKKALEASFKAKPELIEKNLKLFEFAFNC